MQVHQQMVLETDRLILRELTEKDVFAVHELRSDRHNRKYIDNKLDKTIRETMDFIKGIISGIHQKKWAYWGLEIIETQELIGTICLWNFKKEYNSGANYRADIGYEMRTAYQGKGYMTEALLSVIDFGFNTLHFKILEAHTHPKNQKSIQLLERTGFVFDRFIKVEHSVSKTMYDMSIYQLNSE